VVFAALYPSYGLMAACIERCAVLAPKPTGALDASPIQAFGR
jgi:hypothetical protein